MGQDKLKYPITSGPNLHALFQSLGRSKNHGVFDVEFTWTDFDERQVPVAQQQSVVQVMIQGMERPQRTNFWKIRAACSDISHKHMCEINVVMIYDPDKRIGYLDFTQPQPSRVRSAA